MFRSALAARRVVGRMNVDDMMSVRNGVWFGFRGVKETVKDLLDGL